MASNKSLKWSAARVRSEGFKIHKGLYTYEKVMDPVKSKDSIFIFCTRCKKYFPQKVSYHINRKQGCSDCNRGEKITYDVFIRKAKEKHGDKYDYSKINPNSSIGADIKVPIICNLCEEVFPQSVDCHINRDQGCPVCGGTAKYNYERFISRAAKKHDPELFDYSEIAFITDITKNSIVPITCNLCDYRFLQVINDHINSGAGCSNCKGLLRYTYQIFLDKAREAHGNAYDYSLIEYGRKITARSIVKIICNECLCEFNQEVSGHINKKYGCPNCAKCLRYTYEIFVKKAMEIHGDTYDYSRSVGLLKYSYYSKMIIICNKCKIDFKQIIGAHVTNRQGCPRCVMSKGERLIEQYLKNENILYQTQHTISTLPRKRFDFILTEKKILIEFDGEQHFKFIEFFHENEEKFGKLQSVDVMKTVSAVNQGYRIIRIAYNIINLTEYINKSIDSDEIICVSDASLYTAHMDKVMQLIRH